MAIHLCTGCVRSGDATVDFDSLGEDVRKERYLYSWDYEPHDIMSMSVLAVPQRSSAQKSRQRLYQGQSTPIP